MYIDVVTIFETTMKFLKSKEPLTLITNVSDMQGIVQLSRSLGFTTMNSKDKKIQFVENTGKEVHHIIKTV